MFQRVRRMLVSPVFVDDDEKTRLAGVLNPILLIIVGLVVVYGISALFTERDVVSVLIQEGSIALVGLALIWLMRRGRVRLAASVLCILLWAMITLGNWFSGGIRGSGLTSHFGVILIAGLLLGGWGGLIFGGLSVAAGVMVLYGENAGLMPPIPDYVDSAYLLMEFSTVAFGIVGLLYLATRSLSGALKRAYSHESAQIEANRELQTLRDSLEAQVVARTRDLERRSAYLEASAEVSRAIVAILDVEQLAHEIPTLLVRRFDLSQAMIFMADETGQWVESYSAGGETRRLESAQPVRIEAGGHSLIGRCLASGQMQLIDNVSVTRLPVDAYLRSTTHAVALLPLITRGRVIGVLSVESVQVGAFDEDIAVLLQTLADLIAAALDNARLFSESQQALEAERRAYGEFSRKAWEDLMRGEGVAGYTYADKQLMPIDDVLSPKVTGVLQEDAAAVSETAGPVLSVPIAVRGQVIGVVDVLKRVGDEVWSADEGALVRTVAEQLGAALDSARLYWDTQRRAAREQLVGEVTARIRETLDMDVVLQTAAREIEQGLGLYDVTIRLTDEVNAADVVDGR